MCVFDLEGVLVASAAIHAEAWKETFDQFTSHWIDLTGDSVAGFSRRVDYPALIHGRSRLSGAHDFLASRGITLPEGTPADTPGSDTVHGLANRKSSVLMRLIKEHGVNSFVGARLYLRLVHDAGLRSAVVSMSTTTGTLLERAGLAGLVDDWIDGNTVNAEGLRSEPAPDMLLAACRHLDVPPERAAVFETSEGGVTAGRTAGFAMVVGVEQEGNGRALRTSGADLVVADLGAILERSLAP